MKRTTGLLALPLLLALVAPSAPQADDVDSVIWVDEPATSLQKAATPVVSARATPFCIRAGIDTYRLELGVSDAAVERVTLAITGLLTRDGVPVTSIELVDDASGGDETAGDRVFGAGGIALASMQRTFGQAVLRTTPVTLHRSDGSSTTVTVDLALTLHYISPAVPLPRAWSVAPDVRRTTHAVGIVRPLQGTFPVHSVDLQGLGRRYYELFPDDRDFLLAALPFNVSGAPGASLGVVRNDVQGIGLPQFDGAASYGSDGVLQAVARLYWGNVGSGTLNHELLHRWAAYLDPDLDLAAPTDTSYNRRHWGAIQQATTGFARPTAYCGAFDHLEPAPGGGYRGWLDHNANEVDYNPLELYLMGLVEAEEVASPWRVVADPRYLGDETLDGVRYSRYAGSFLRTIGIDDVLAAHGRRQPRPAEAQRAFRAALVVAYDRPLFDTELAYYDVAMRDYERATSTVLESTFFHATGGRAALTTAVPAPAGEVGPSLRLDKREGGSIALAWGPSCAPSEDDFVVYEGQLGDFATHRPRLCSTERETGATLDPSTASSYYLVVPRSATTEGSPGTTSAGAERPAGAAACAPQGARACS